MKPDINTQLYWLKGLTERFGVLHEFQVAQLKGYCAILPASGTIEVRVSMEKHFVMFESTSDKRFRRTPKNQQLLNLMVEWLRTVLWSDTEYSYTLNGKKVYDSRYDRKTDSGDLDTIKDP